MTGNVSVPQFSVRKQHELLRDELVATFEEVLDTGQFIMAGYAEKFEQELAAYCQVEHAVAVNSGTDALQLALTALDLGPGDDVIVPGFTFVATATAPIWAGCYPVLADVGWDGNLTVETVDDAWTPATRAVIAVHLYGKPAPMEGLRQLCAERGAWLIEDAAQGLGAQYRGRPVGSLGTMACFSFFPTKTLGALGDAGAVTTDDAYLADRLRLLRAHGARKKYEHVGLGRNSRMDELQAAFLSLKLKHLPDYLTARQRLADQYTLELAEHEAVTLPEAPADIVPSWHQYTVQVARRNGARQYLAEHGIDASVHYPLTVAQQPFWARHGLETPDLPIAQHLAERVLCLPIWPELTLIDATLAAQTLVEFLELASDSGRSLA